jgi:hypothetical protein
LAISGIYFLRWFTRGRNYLVMIYGLVMLFLFANSIIGAIYLSQVSVTHGQTIKRTSCSVMSTLNISSYPPLGAVSIAFMGLASYLVYLGIYSAATITARDRSLRKELHHKIENNIMLLKRIATS